MKKAVIFFILFSFGLLSWTIFDLEEQAKRASFEDPCPFCDPKVIEKQAIYEDEQVIALLDYRPFLPGHVLIIPKRHIERFEEATEKEAGHIAKVIKRVDQAVKKVYGTSSYLLLQKNGKEVGQTVQHVHFHYIPRKQGNFSVFPMLARMYVTPLRKPMPEKELRWQTSVLRKEIEGMKDYTI